MKKWIITGYSYAMDGLLYVVEAETEVAAIRTVGRINNTVYRKITVDNVSHHVLCTEKILDEELRYEIKEGEPRWFWQVNAQELKFDTNHADAVCW